MSRKISLYTLDIVLLKWFANIFSQCMSLPFHFLDCILWSTKFKILIWSIFFFSFCCLCICCQNSASVHWCWIEMQTQSFGWSRKEWILLLCQAKGATVGYCPQDCMTHPGVGSEKFFSVQGRGHDQLVDNSWIGWHQGEAWSVINLLVSTNLGSMFLWSAAFIWRWSASCKNNSGLCVRPLSISFRELQVQWFCSVAEL